MHYLFSYPHNISLLNKPFNTLSPISKAVESDLKRERTAISVGFRNSCIPYCQYYAENLVAVLQMLLSILLIIFPPLS